MTAIITDIAQNFSEDELRQVLDTPEVRVSGNYGFAGLKCPKCHIKANVPVSYLWSCAWTCICGNLNPCNSRQGEWQLPLEDPDVGPSRSMLNRVLRDLGIVGRIYAEPDIA